MKKKSNKAFTLAEVLITLTIIGVIAAITVPAVISQQGDAELTSRFKKTVSTFNQVLNSTNNLDFGGDTGCYYGEGSAAGSTAGCSDFWNKFVQNLSIIKTCNGNALKDGCVPKYSKYAASEGCAGFNEGHINNDNYAYVLADGQIIITYKYGSKDSRGPLFLVDINGMKGPNKGGYDLFSFSIIKSDDKGVYLSAGGCEIVETGGRRASDMMMHAFAGQE